MPATSYGKSIIPPPNIYICIYARSVIYNSARRRPVVYEERVFLTSYSSNIPGRFSGFSFFQSYLYAFYFFHFHPRNLLFTCRNRYIALYRAYNGRLFLAKSFRYTLIVRRFERRTQLRTQRY